MPSVFSIDPAIFDAFPYARFAAVVVRDLDNHRSSDEAAERMLQAVGTTRQRFEGIDPKSHPSIAIWREVFGSRGWTPSKYLSSIEALIRRITKGGEPPSINPAVDLANSVSIDRVIPLGAHDLRYSPEGMVVRLARPGDVFQPMGDAPDEVPDEGEIVYAHGQTIATRRWVWRQSRVGLVTAEARDILFPIDGFAGVSENDAYLAAETLAEIIPQYLGGIATIHHLNPEHPSTE